MEALGWSSSAIFVLLRGLSEGFDLTTAEWWMVRSERAVEMNE